MEVHPFETHTPTDQQFLTGAADTPRVTIAGELRLPVAGTDRLPAIVLLHGSGGISSHLQAWVHELNGMGIATFVVDSFAGRKITSTVADQDRLSRLAMVVDAYRALDLLAAHPRIDPARVRQPAPLKIQFALPFTGAFFPVPEATLLFAHVLAPVGPSSR